MWTKLQEYSDLNQQDSYLAWGMLQIFRGVAFLHEANLIHGSLHAGSVFVTPAGKYNSNLESSVSYRISLNKVRGH